ncbi:hypothetical protein ZOD2009_17613 [Haladaptatus paucihalophilus DX253]|uniref:Uncharacterized protein n=1 Tax=Haladaptatus paucihalophilus DX253 TaxID=797209 RepID=E7QXI4_HALPU|nr:hypothetical protein [Haladaptatus paucihalophilus]EFW90987.1 hypothetical protein ZOD2009_17613 [Haladaptatus paucihalophilus DX253]SHK28429.1 hypothetical protein SAMN05444342_1199 [Haladaptatus paucihalophilus DX253]
MAVSVTSWVPDRENLLVAACCLMAAVAAYDYHVGAYGGTVVATVGAGIALTFLVLLSE